MSNALLHRTRAHYDAHPFIQGGTKRISWWREYLTAFLPDDVIRDRLILDVGSSVGEISRGLIDRGARLVCLDLSLESLRMCRTANPEADVFHGDALDLPFPDESFDHAISIGVLHHTPDCRRGFDELVRVTAPGGLVVVFLYNFWNLYHAVYRLFWPVRTLIPLARTPAWTLQLLQPFVRRRFQQELDDVQLRNLLGDKLWTPRASFHSVSEVSRWGVANQLTLVSRKKFFMGYANVMAFRKAGAPSRAGLLLRARCLQCRAGEMTDAGGQLVCGVCGQSYPLDGGIFRTMGSD